MNFRSEGRIFWLIREGRYGFSFTIYFYIPPFISKLADWFKPGTTRMIPSDKGGNYYLDRDPKAFRHILAYLRFKKERCVGSLGLLKSCWKEIFIPRQL